MVTRIESICLNHIQPASTECEECKREYLETGLNGKSCFTPVKLTVPYFPNSYTTSNEVQGLYLG